MFDPDRYADEFWGDDEGDEEVEMSNVLDDYGDPIPKYILYYYHEYLKLTEEQKLNCNHMMASAKNYIEMFAPNGGTIADED